MIISVRSLKEGEGLLSEFVCFNKFWYILPQLDSHRSEGGKSIHILIGRKIIAAKA